MVAYLFMQHVLYNSTLPACAVPAFFIFKEDMWQSQRVELHSQFNIHSVESIVWVEHDWSLFYTRSTLYTNSLHFDGFNSIQSENVIIAKTDLHKETMRIRSARFLLYFIALYRFDGGGIRYCTILFTFVWILNIERATSSLCPLQLWISFASIFQ